MNPRVQPLAEIFSLNTDLVANCVEGLDEDDVQRRLSGGGNSIAFLLAHLADARHFLVEALGTPCPNPLADTLADVSSIEEVEQMPAFDEIRDAWEAVSSHLARVLDGLTEADLDRSIDQTFPIRGGTMVQALTFLAQHDSYHVGQIAFLRRQLGHAAMSYERRVTR